MKERDVDRQERRECIEESTYNAACKFVMTEELLLYLNRESGVEKKLIAWLRWGHEEMETRYWMDKKKRK